MDTLRKLTIYALNNDMYDTAEFTAERILAQYDNDLNISNKKQNNYKNSSDKSRNSNNNSIHNAIITGTPTPNKNSIKNILNNEDIEIEIEIDQTSTNLSSSNELNKLDAIHLYSYILYKRGKFKTAFNITCDNAQLHIGCAYIFAQCSLKLGKEIDGIRILLRTMNIWESNNYNYNYTNLSDIIPDSIAFYLLLGKLYSSIGDIPRATIHYSNVLKLNPYIFEALEQLCKLGVKVNVDAIYKNNGEFLINAENDINDDIIINDNNNNNNDNDVDNDELDITNNPLFKTPITKPTITTSSPESNFMTPINKSSLLSKKTFSKKTFKTSKNLHNNNNINTNASTNNSNSININSFLSNGTKRNTSITSRLINNGSNLLNKDIKDVLKKDSGDSIDNSIINNTTDEIFKIHNIEKGNLFNHNNNNNNNNTAANVNTNNKPSSTNRAVKNEYIRNIYCKIGKGISAFNSFDCFQAIRIFDSLPENERNTPYILSKLGKLHFEIVNYEESENYFEKLRKIDRTRLEDMEIYSTLLWHLHKEIELSFLSHELFEIDDKHPNTWISIGNLFSFKKEPEDAIKCFNKAIEFDDKCLYAYTLKGHEYLATDSFENSINSFRNAIVLDKHHYNAFYGIGMVYLKLGDFHKAEYHFRKAVEINPVNVILICCVGMVLEKLGKREESLKQYEFAVKLQPLSMLALFKKAQILYNLKRYEEALKYFEKLENLAPDEASVHFLLGKLYKFYGRKHEAVKQFTIALNLDPKGSHLIKEAMESLNDGIID
ncbi:anaphase promoting complex subunit [Pichia kluyveri]|uniref:Anaphase promoting complex subunit n=1 Tax=Pichia kluyveri TaxID=36015 RepID=A0AAV5QZX7_PICKL|nr:anaphase promoting complex subunit [Pichia kluyveri]